MAEIGVLGSRVDEIFSNLLGIFGAGWKEVLLRVHIITLSRLIRTVFPASRID
jgi:hypothetical protein